MNYYFDFLDLSDDLDGIARTFFFCFAVNFGESLPDSADCGLYISEYLLLNRMPCIIEL